MEDCTASGGRNLTTASPTSEDSTAAAGNTLTQVLIRLIDPTVDMILLARVFAAGSVLRAAVPNANAGPRDCCAGPQAVGRPRAGGLLIVAHRLRIRAEALPLRVDPRRLPFTRPRHTRDPWLGSVVGYAVSSAVQYRRHAQRSDRLDHCLPAIFLGLRTPKEASGSKE